METIKISEKKLKIMLTEDDLLRYDISVPVDVASVTGRDRLRRLLRDACCDFEFDPDSGRVFVQIYESAAGGCELFVTQHEKMRREESVTNVTGTPRILMPKSRSERAVYAFPDLDSLLAVCGRLARPGRAASAAYVGDGVYYLLTYEPESRLDAICGEYDGERCTAAAVAYLSEHCDCICKTDAVGVLGKLG